MKYLALDSREIHVHTSESFHYAQSIYFDRTEIRHSLKAHAVN